jgi:ketosteroid isomerase-like protein
MPTLTVPEAFEATNREWMEAYERGDAAGVAGCHTETARILPPAHEAIEGREGIRAYWQQARDAGMTRIRLEADEFVVLGELAVELGRYTFGTDELPDNDHGKYVVVWQREGDAWRWHRNLWNSSKVVHA